MTVVTVMLMSMVYLVNRLHNRNDIMMMVVIVLG